MAERWPRSSCQPGATASRAFVFAVARMGPSTQRMISRPKAEPRMHTAERAAACARPGRGPSRGPAVPECTSLSEPSLPPPSCSAGGGNADRDRNAGDPVRRHVSPRGGAGDGLGHVQAAILQDGPQLLVGLADGADAGQVACHVGHAPGTRRARRAVRNSEPGSEGRGPCRCLWRQ